MTLMIYDNLWLEIWPCYKHLLLSGRVPPLRTYAKLYDVIAKDWLEEHYVNKRKSMQEIAVALGVSQHTVAYYMQKYAIPRRTRSEATYQKRNPHGDPFKLAPIRNKSDIKLLGIGIGLYWGEGTKSNRHSVRLGNTDPELIKTFMLFLTRIFSVDKKDMRFGLQIFTDINPDEALEFWARELDVSTSQFYKLTVTISGSIGTYRKKSQYGVVTVHYHNKKLRDILVSMLPR